MAKITWWQNQDQNAGPLTPHPVHSVPSRYQRAPSRSSARPSHLSRDAEAVREAGLVGGLSSVLKAVGGSAPTENEAPLSSQGRKVWRDDR